MNDVTRKILAQQIKLIDDQLEALDKFEKSGRRTVVTDHSRWVCIPDKVAIAKERAELSDRKHQFELAMRIEDVK